MRKYKEAQDGQLIQVICNGCGREMKLENGYLKEGCFSADTVFGYFSKKDGMRHRFELCEQCYDKMTSGFAVPVEETAENEII